MLLILCQMRMIGGSFLLFLNTRMRSGGLSRAMRSGVLSFSLHLARSVSWMSEMVGSRLLTNLGGTDISHFGALVSILMTLGYAACGGGTHGCHASPSFQFVLYDPQHSHLRPRNPHASALCLVYSNWSLPRRRCFRESNPSSACRQTLVARLWQEFLFQIHRLWKIVR